MFVIFHGHFQAVWSVFRKHRAGMVLFAVACARHRKCRFKTTSRSKRLQVNRNPLQTSSQNLQTVCSPNHPPIHPFIHPPWPPKYTCQSIMMQPSTQNERREMFADKLLHAAYPSTVRVGWTTSRLMKFIGTPFTVFGFPVFQEKWRTPLLCSWFLQVVREEIIRRAILVSCCN